MSALLPHRQLFKLIDLLCPIEFIFKILIYSFYETKNRLKRLGNEILP